MQINQYEQYSNDGKSPELKQKQYAFGEEKSSEKDSKVKSSSHKSDQM